MQKEIENYLARFDPERVYESEQVQSLPPHLRGREFSRIVNAGELLRTLHTRGGYSVGPERFRSLKTLKQRAKLFLDPRREGVVSQAILDLRDAQQAVAAQPTPQPQPEMGAPGIVPRGVDYRGIQDSWLGQGGR